MANPPLPGVRISELSRRSGVSIRVLRAWERRYGVLQPARSPGGYRLYSEADENRVSRMKLYLAAAEAALAALSEEGATASQTGPADRGSLTATAAVLARSLEDFDEPGAHSALDRLLADFTVESVLRDAIIPYLHDLGERWQRGQASVACEHFASNILRGRLAGLARGWGYGPGPRAFLACPPGEQHDLALLAFGIVLHRNGWKVDYLGTDTPIGELTRAVDDTHPDVTVLAAVTPERYNGLTADLARLAAAAPLGLAGAGASEALTRRRGRFLPADPVTEAQNLRIGLPA